MAKYYRVTTPVEGKDGKTRFNNCGVAFPSKDGQNYVMKLELHSLPVNGELVLFEPKSEEENEEQS